MSAIGLNVDRAGSYPPALVRSLGATWIRLVAMRDHDLREYLAECRAAGLRVLLVLARESFGGFDSYADGLATYARRYGGLVDAWQIGNEADLASPSSWTMDPGELSELGQLARAALPGARLVCAGMASGHPEYLDAVDLTPFDAVACHPYLKDAPNPSDVEDLPDVDQLVEAYRAYGLPVWVTEWGWWGADERRGAEETAEMVAWAASTDLIEAFFYFCLSDAMVPPFGLLRADGSEKPAAAAFRQAALAAPVQIPTPPTEAPVPVEEIPMPTHTHDVGSGLLAWMSEDGTAPIACSTFLPLGRNPAEIESAYGENGREYRWSLVQNRRLARFDPDSEAA